LSFNPQAKEVYGTILSIAVDSVAANKCKYNTNYNTQTPNSLNCKIKIINPTGDPISFKYVTVNTHEFYAPAPTEPIDTGPTYPC
jgi:hypothetical protein